MWKLEPWMYFVLMILSFVFVIFVIVIEAIIFGHESLTTLSTLIPLAIAFLAQIKRKED